MERALRFLGQLRELFLRVSETGLALVAFIFVVYLLLGEDSGGFVLAVVENAGHLVEALTPQAIVGVALAVAFVALFRTR